jgi:hypothetical protein
MMPEAYSGDTIVDYNGKPTRIADIADPHMRAMEGYGHFPGHGRKVLDLHGRKFPHTPETCLTDLYSCKWTDDNMALMCTGCGLDCT